MKKYEILNKIRILLETKFDLELSEINTKKSLFEQQFSPSDLVVLFMEIEKIFSIEFSIEFINEKNILYIDNIIDYIYKF